MANTKPNSSQIKYNPEGTGAVVTDVQSKLREIVSVKDFGAEGDGTNDTTKLQNAFNAAENKTLLLEAGKNYGYTTLTIKPNTTIISNDATFTRLTASTSHGFVIQSGVSIDSLTIVTPGGTGGDKAVAIRGKDVFIEFANISAVAQGSAASTNVAIEIESSTSGAALSRIIINQLYCKNFSTAVSAKNVSFLEINNAIVEYYRQAFYYRDVARSESHNVVCRYTAESSTGRPGENGLLIESSLSSGSCRDLKFNGWVVQHSGEHAYRIGGQLTVENVWFENCRAEKSGSAIVINNSAATAWTGGCGFKVLGATTVTGEKHKNIYFNNCTVEDINETFGVFPAGHGFGNFAGFQVACASNVHISNCSVLKKDNKDYSCSYGAEILASDHVYFNNVSFTDMYHSVRIHEAGSVGTYPGWDLPCEHIYFNGCLIESSRPGLEYLLGIGEVAQNFNHSNIEVRDSTLSGASHAVRILPITGTGSYNDIYLNFTYVDCTETPATASEPVIYGADASVVDITAPWHAAAYSPTTLDGSRWCGTNDGQLREKSDGVWRSNPKTYSVLIANDAFAIVTPPKRDVGFIMVTGGGTATHIMGWYRATSVPAGTKYAGSLTTDMVNTALTGTTGTDGNVTIGVQNNQIYIENREGVTNTFKVTFL